MTHEHQHRTTATERPASGTDADALAPDDAFAAARWLDSVWNSRARAVGPELIEWKCTTWGSGKGRAYWVDTAAFTVVASAFGFRSWSDWDGRDELVVEVPLARFAEVMALLTRLGEEPEAWPWLDCEVPEPVAMAAEMLGLPVEDVDSNDDLLEALRLV